jgi:hypothetical protein
MRSAHAPRKACAVTGVEVIDDFCGGRRWTGFASLPHRTIARRAAVRYQAGVCVCTVSPLGHNCDVPGHRSQVSRDIVHV